MRQVRGGETGGGETSETGGGETGEIYLKECDVIMEQRDMPYR